MSPTAASWPRRSSGLVHCQACRRSPGSFHRRRIDPTLYRDRSFISDVGDIHRLKRQWRKVGHRGLSLSLRQSGLRPR